MTTVTANPVHELTHIELAEDTPPPKVHSAVTDDGTPPYKGDLRLAGSQAYCGFLEDCINVVWVPDEEMSDGHVTGQVNK
jgi:hypothetical protein